MEYTATQQVQIRFSVPTAYGRYTNALYYPPDAVPEQSVIDAAIAQRVADWVYTVEHPEPIEEPEPEWTVTCEDGEVVDA